MDTQSNSLAFDSGWQYSPAPESTDHIRIDKRYGLFIGGDFVEPEEGGYFATLNPATEETLAEVARATEADVDKAVAAARKACQGPWSKMKPAERGKYVYRIARLLQERAREFAVVETLDGGKPIRESRDIDIPLVARHFYYHAGMAQQRVQAPPLRHHLGILLENITDHRDQQQEEDRQGQSDQDAAPPLGGPQGQGQHAADGAKAAVEAETFTDAAFAFAVTLLVISIDQIPRSYDELLVALAGIPVAHGAVGSEFFAAPGVTARHGGAGQQQDQ